MNILFDLDGTLTDPCDGITSCVAYAIEKLGEPPLDSEQLNKFVGPPIYEAFPQIMGLDDEKTELGVKYYRERFAEEGIYKNEVYDGIEELLIQLKANGHKVMLATSKPQIFAEKILRHFDLYKYFDFISGATMDKTCNKKADVIKYVLDECGIHDSAIMVGDRMYDIIGAKDNNIASVGVLYGYGDRAELESAGADYIVGSAYELKDLLLGM